MKKKYECLFGFWCSSCLLLLINLNLLFLTLFFAVWQSIDTRAEVLFVATDTEGCGDNQDETFIMTDVSDMVSHFPALRHLEDISKNLSLGPDGEQTLSITVYFSARGTNTDENTFNQFLKTKLKEKHAESSSCFTLQSIAVVTQDDSASMPSLKKKTIKSNKK